MATLFAATVGGLVDLATSPFPPLIFTIPLGLLIGIVGTVGLLSFRRNRLLLGLLVGVGVGLAAGVISNDPWLALVAGTVAIVYRLAGRFWFGGRDMVEALGEGLEAADVPFVAPYTSGRRKVGVDWAERTARELGWTFRRAPADVGIVASLDDIVGPTFDPDAVAPWR